MNILQHRFLWECYEEPQFTKEWTAKPLRYRHPRHWNWLRIYVALFWLVAMPTIIVLAIWH